MATQTQLITRRPVRFLRATIGVYMIVACSGLILLSAGSAHALSGVNGMPRHGVSFNRLSLNGIHMNGLSLQAPTLQQKPLPAGSQERLPWNGLSRRALGKSMQ